MKTLLFLGGMILMITTCVYGQYSIGDVADNFSLKNTNGEMVNLSDFDTEGVIVIFTSNTCPYAVMYEDRIIDLHNKYSANGFPVVAIQPNDPEIKPGDSYEKMKEKVASKGMSYNYLFDEGQTVYPKFGAQKTPHVFLLDANKKVRYIGAIDDNAQNASAVKEAYLENAINALKNGQEPSPSETKAIGCRIKAKS